MPPGERRARQCQVAAGAGRAPLPRHGDEPWGLAGGWGWKAPGLWGRAPDQHPSSSVTDSLFSGCQEDTRCQPRESHTASTSRSWVLTPVPCPAQTMTQHGSSSPGPYTHLCPNVAEDVGGKKPGPEPTEVPRRAAQQRSPEHRGEPGWASVRGHWPATHSPPWK